MKQTKEENLIKVLGKAASEKRPFNMSEIYSLVKSLWRNSTSSSSGSGVQSDWNQTDNTQEDYIKNKPTIPSAPTAATIAAINHGTAEKTAIVDADEVTGQDSANSFSLIRTTWVNVKAFLKTYFDTLYAAKLGSDDNYVTDAEKVVISNTSGINTGDNAVNSNYSGLAASKQDTLVSATNIKTINGSTLLGAGDLTITGSVPVSWGRYF
jgi:hypothetical protein